VWNQYCSVESKQAIFRYLGSCLLDSKILNEAMFIHVGPWSPWIKNTKHAGHGPALLVTFT